MKKIIVMLIIIVSLFGILACTKTISLPGDLFTEETSNLWDDILDRFDGAEVLESEVGKGDKKIILQLTTFVSDDKGVVLEKIVRDGEVTYHLAVFYPEYEGYLHAEISLSDSQVYFTDMVYNNYFPLKTEKWDELLNRMIEAFNQANVKVNNELHRKVYENRILDSLGESTMGTSFSI